MTTELSRWPYFTTEELAAVERVLSSGKVNYWTGEEAREFEKEFAGWVGTSHAIALANGTVALDLALHGLGIGVGDEVIVTPRTFVASVSSVVNAGAIPIFADINRDSGNISAETIAPKITSRTTAIIPVHLAGWPCDMDAIMKLAELHDLKVIEDCAQAHGARYKNRSVGSIGHVGAWSFCQDKIMTTGGEGGMVTTSDADVWSRMWSFKDHGKSWNAVYEREHPPGFRWLHESFGTNWRMMELQAAIGRIQLGRIAHWTERRNHNANKIREALVPYCDNEGPIRLPEFRCASCGNVSDCNECVHAYYKFYAYVRSKNIHAEWNRDRIVYEIGARGVPCFQGSCSEVYRERAFDNTDWRPKDPLPIAHELGESSLMLLVHPSLTDSEVDRMCEVVTQVFDLAIANR